MAPVQLYRAARIGRGRRMGHGGSCPFRPAPQTSVRQHGHRTGRPCQTANAWLGIDRTAKAGRADRPVSRESARCPAEEEPLVLGRKGRRSQ